MDRVARGHVDGRGADIEAGIPHHLRGRFGIV
jgi:hypothetical protein